jgi:hypothetical protein
MALAQVTIAVPDPSHRTLAWVPSSLISISSVGLSKTATPSDVVQLYGSNDNTVTIGPTYALNQYNGPGQQQGATPPAFKFYAVSRVGGTTAGLSLVLEGPDGAGGGSPVTLQVPPFSTPGQLTASNTVTHLPSAAVTTGVWVQNDLTSTANVRVGDSTITTTRGFQLAPGQAFFFPCNSGNAQQVYIVAESGSPVVNLVLE